MMTTEEAALAGYEAEKERINAVIRDLKAKIAPQRATTIHATSETANGAEPKRTMSATARKAIARAQKERWRKYHAQQAGSRLSHAGHRKRASR